jgi:hypothetical protein
MNPGDLIWCNECSNHTPSRGLPYPPPVDVLSSSGNIHQYPVSPYIVFIMNKKWVLCGHVIVYMNIHVHVRICACFLSFVYIPYVLLLEIQSSVGGGWVPINRFNSATFLCLSQARTWISNVTCHGLFVFCEFSLDERWLLVLLILSGGIDDHHCLNFLFIMYNYSLWIPNDDQYLNSICHSPN